FHKKAAGITEDRDQQEDAHLGAGDPHALLAEIDLQLVARRLSTRTVASCATRRSRRMSATARSMVRTLTVSPRSASRRCTTTAFPPAGPSYSVRASRRRSS